MSYQKEVRWVEDFHGASNPKGWLRWKSSHLFIPFSGTLLIHSLPCIDGADRDLCHGTGVAPGKVKIFDAKSVISLLLKSYRLVSFHLYINIGAEIPTLQTILGTTCMLPGYLPVWPAAILRNISARKERYSFMSSPCCYLFYQKIK